MPTWLLSQVTTVAVGFVLLGSVRTMWQHENRSPLYCLPGLGCSALPPPTFSMEEVLSAALALLLRVVPAANGAPGYTERP